MPARLLRLAADERLVELVRDGSEPAFEAVFDRHHRGILAFCRHMLGSAEEAEDAVQHVFLAAYRSLLAEPARHVHLRPWLYTIARNRCLSVLRARRERPLDDVAEPSTEHLSDAVQRREDLRTLLRDLAELPDDQRAALVLAEIGDVSHEEIAEVLDVRREKVKALVFQARSSLAAARAAREVSCAEVREQLAELRGGALRRTPLRRHLRECPGCREFRSAIAAQRRALAVLVPVAPTAGLKAAVLGSAFGGGAAAAGGAATGAGMGSGAAGGSAAGASGTAALTGASSVGGAGLAAKALVVVAVAGSGVAVGTRELSASHDAPAARHAAPAPGHHAGRAAPAPAPHARHGAASPAPARSVRATAGVTGRPAARGRHGAKGHHGAKAHHSSPASAIAHENGHRARGHGAAGADGNHGLGDGAGGGRTQAPGRLTKAPGNGHASPGGGTAAAPGRLKTPGTSAGGSRGASRPAAAPAAPAHGAPIRPATSNAGGASRPAATREAVAEPVTPTVPTAGTVPQTTRQNRAAVAPAATAGDHVGGAKAH